MAFECKNHAGADAAWMCVGCEGVFCGDCIELKKFGRTTVEACKDCGELCNAVQRGIAVQEVGLADEFGDAFSYPLREAGPMILLGGTLVAAAMDFFGVALFGWGIFLGYGMLIIKSTAEGRDKAPQWPDVSTLGDIAKPVVLACATALLSFYPASWAFEQGNQGLGVGLALAGAVYAPMAWIAASISGNFLAITPITVLPLLLKVNYSYWVACGVLMGVGLVGVLGTSALAALPLPFVGGAVVTAAAFYLLMVEMRILGLVWYHNRDELGLS